MDNKIINFILDNTDIFKNIHPNYVTSFGIIINFVLLYLCIDKKKINITMIGILLLLRWFVDCLDGNIARKYDKKSDFGNKLDGISDMMLQIFFIFYLCRNIKDKVFTIVLVSLYVLYFYKIIIHDKFFETHENIKNENGNILQKTTSFIVNNSFIVYILAFFIIKNIDDIKFFYDKYIL